MPDNNTKPTKTSRKLNNLLDLLGTQTQDLFKATYHSSDVNKQMFNKVSSDLNTSIQNAISSDDNFADLSNVSQLYEKIIKKSGGLGTSNTFDKEGKDGDSMIELFSNQDLLANLMNTYASTKWIKILDEEIDMCCKYMPKLQIALNIKKDNVLCADSFSQSFITPTPLIKLSDDQNGTFSKNSEYIEKIYQFESNVERWYMSTSKYGETFVYCVPYEKALRELLKRKKSTQYAMKESYILENGRFGEGFKPPINSSIKVDPNGNGSIKLKLDRTGLIGSVLENVNYAREKLKNSMFCQSLYEDVLHEANGKEKEYKLDKTIDDVLSYDDSTPDGLIDPNKKEQDDANKKLDVPGCVVRTLDRGSVIPLYIEDICLGYYYITLHLDDLVDVNTASVSNGYNSITSMFNNRTTVTGTTMSNETVSDADEVLKYVSAMISKNIDANFINSNQDLRKEIYMMLKYNDRFNRTTNSIDMNVTFIPPEDIVHIKFNEDPITHRGRSDLWDGLIAAKMWIMLNTTTVLGNAIRSQDHRVYYVKTMVETNVAKTLLNVVSQIKKGNFGMRQMESINNILNIVGKFNDFVIPVGPSGDQPVTFDIMQGQSFEMPTDLMNQLEESAISSTGVPLEIVNSSLNMDFAIRYTMTNGRLLRDIIARQALYSKPLSILYTKIYNCEFNDHMDIKIKLPMPSFLLTTQGSQLIQNTTQYIDAISEAILGNTKDDNYKAMFKKKMLYNYLPGYIEPDMIDEIMKEVEVELSIDKSKAVLTGEEQ